MFIKFYGTRGSVPVSNKTITKYGGNTTCLYIESKAGDSVVVDAGTGIRELGSYLVKERKRTINLIFTHYHWDHIQGFPFFGPIFKKDTILHIYGPAADVMAEKALSYQMTVPYFPTDLSKLPAQIIFKELKSHLNIGGLKIETIINNHPNHTRGIKFIENKKSFAFLTDNEILAQTGNTSYQKFVDFLSGVNLLIHDAQYTNEEYEAKMGWGHSTYQQAVKLAQGAGVKQIILTHHDSFSSDKFIDKNIKKIKKMFPKQNIQAAADGNSITLK